LCVYICTASSSGAKSVNEFPARPAKMQPNVNFCSSVIIQLLHRRFQIVGSKVSKMLEYGSGPTLKYGRCLGKFAGFQFNRNLSQNCPLL